MKLRAAVLVLLVPALASSAFALAGERAACPALVPLEGIVEPAPAALVGPEETALPPGQPAFDACALRIQPGARMTSPAGCTMNWIFRDEAGDLYIGTAGHCLGASGSSGRRVSMQGVGSMGEAVYVLNDGVGRDFGLVRIDADKHDKVDPTLCKWGGPTALANGAEHPGERLVLQYGYGIGWGATQFTRARAFEGSTGVAALSLRGFSSGGDSGSPLMYADGEAAGVLTHGLGAPVVNFGLGLTYGSRLDVAVARAEAALGVDLSLVTSEVPVQFGYGVPFVDPLAST